jgi:hypothetical protein|tara:strand:- start:206 stop:382 length:177 start_codon:yes stop_codon:yes gene_type:complete
MDMGMDVDGHPLRSVSVHRKRKNVFLFKRPNQADSAKAPDKLDSGGGQTEEGCASQQT